MDSTGSTVVEYKYDSWGVILEITGSMASTLSTDNPYRYKGYYYDEETGLYYLGSRYYDPQMCRFISPDSLSAVTKSLSDLWDKNLYAYCDNDPVNREDESGDAWILVAMGFGVIAGVTGQFASDVFTSVMSGEIVISDWQSYAGAGVGGALGALTLSLTGNLDAANAVSGFSTTATSMTLRKVTEPEKEKTSAVDILGYSLCDGLTSYGLGKLTSGLNAITLKTKTSSNYVTWMQQLKKGICKTEETIVMRYGLRSTAHENVFSYVWNGFKQFMERINRKYR